MLYEMEVVAEVAADVVEEHAAMDRLGGRSRMVCTLGVTIHGRRCPANYT
jgi:hypothetical protein